MALRERGQAVQEAGRRHRQADAGLLRQEAGDRRGVAGVLLVAERNHAHARGLRLAREVGDRDAGQAEDRVDAVQLEGIDDEVKAVGHFQFAYRLSMSMLRCLAFSPSIEQVSFAMDLPWGQQAGSLVRRRSDSA